MHPWRVRHPGWSNYVPASASNSPVTPEICTPRTEPSQLPSSMIPAPCPLLLRACKEMPAILEADRLQLPHNPGPFDGCEILDALPVLIFTEHQGKILFANAEARRILGKLDAPWQPIPTDELIWGLRAGTAEPHTRITDHGRARPFHATLPSSHGRILSVEGVICPEENDPETAIIIAHPTQVERAPRSRLMEDVLGCMPEAVALVHGNNILYVNAAFSRIFGYSSEEALGNRILDLIVPETRRTESLSLRRSVDEQGYAALDTVRLTKTGDLVDVATQVSQLTVSGQPAGYIFTYRDIGERKQIEAKLQHDALHDPLTGLPNRALFLDRLKLALSRRARRHDLGCATLFIDLDRFKEINDNLGHAAGDELLIAVAQRLQAAIRPQDTASRLGGDEFAVLLENLPSTKELELVSTRIQNELNRPFELYGHPVETGASIGVAMATEEHTAAELLIRDADFAMYRAKQRGGRRFEIFDHQLQISAAAPADNERELRQVIEKHQFELWYQPICRLINGKIEGFESLLRRQMPEGNFESFRSLLPIAEETGLSITLGRETLETVSRQLRNWLDRLPSAQLSLTLNLSARQFYHPELLSQIKRSFAITGADPSHLVLEVDEVTLNQNPTAAATILRKLADCNLHLAVDNFGSGLGSLNHLIQLPVDVLKLSPAFTVSASASARQAAVLESLIRLGRSLGVQIVAQGIETLNQLRSLTNLGIEVGQGFLFSPAVAPKEAELFARTGFLKPDAAPPSGNPPVMV